MPQGRLKAFSLDNVTTLDDPMTFRFRSLPTSSFAM